MDKHKWVDPRNTIYAWKRRFMKSSEYFSLSGNLPYVNGNTGMWMYWRSKVAITISNVALINNNI